MFTSPAPRVRTTSFSKVMLGMISIISSISLATIGSIELRLLIESARVEELMVLIGNSFAEYMFSSIRASTLDKQPTKSLNRSLVREYLCGWKITTSLLSG